MQCFHGNSGHSLVAQRMYNFLPSKFNKGIGYQLSRTAVGSIIYEGFIPAGSCLFCLPLKMLKITLSQTMLFINMHEPESLRFHSPLPSVYERFEKYIYGDLEQKESIGKEHLVNQILLLFKFSSVPKAIDIKSIMR